MKKFISLLCLLVLAACSSNNTPPAHDSTTPFYKYMTRLEGEEILIRGIIKTPDNKTYLLSDNEDYEFSGIDALYLHRIHTNEIPEHYNKVESDGRRYYLKPLRAMGQNDAREARPNLYYAMNAPDGTQVFPIRTDGSDGNWRWSKQSVRQKQFGTTRMLVAIALQ